MSSRLLCDPHPRTTKKASASAAAVQLLLRRSGSGRAAAKDESIEFFSALRECQHVPRVSGQTEIGPADRRGKTRRSGGETELLSTEIGKHDYDWLLTPPATPLPAATSGTTAALNRLTRATSASYAKSNSPLSLARRDNGNPTSRLARSSSASHSSVNTPAFASSYRQSHVRTLSSASLSSINAPSNASGRSTPSGSAATSPRTPSTARSAAAASSPTTRPQDKAKVSSGSSAASQPNGSSSSSTVPSAPTIVRPRAPTTDASSPKSTRLASEQPVQTTRRGANAVARSRFASQVSSAMSTAQSAQNDVRSSITKPRPAPAAVKQCHGNGTAAMSRTASTKSWLSASLSASRGELLANKRASGSGDYGGKINVDKATTPRRAAGLASAATSSGLTRTGSRKSANADAKRAVNEDLRPTAQHRSIHSSIASRSRLGSASTSSAAGSIARGRRATTQKGKATVTARVAGADAFPSTRYDAMLLREDPKNLTWLNGCGDDDGDEDGICGVGLVEGSLELEPFSVAVTGTSGAAA